jgi:hypothetical protein
MWRQMCLGRIELLGPLFWKVPLLYETCISTCSGQQYGGEGLKSGGCVSHSTQLGSKTSKPKSVGHSMVAHCTPLSVHAQYASQPSWNSSPETYRWPLNWQPATNTHDILLEYPTVPQGVLSQYINQYTLVFCVNISHSIFRLETTLSFILLQISTEPHSTQILISGFVRSSYRATRFDHKSVIFRSFHYKIVKLQLQTQLSMITLRLQSLVVTKQLFLFSEDNYLGKARK